MQSLLQWLLAKLHKLAHRGHLPVVRLAPLDLLIQVQVDLVDQTQHGSAVDIMDIGAGPSAGGNPSAPSSKSSRLAMYSWQQISVGGPKILIFRVPRSSISCAWHSASCPWRYNPRFYGLVYPPHNYSISCAASIFLACRILSWIFCSSTRRRWHSIRRCRWQCRCR